MTTRQTLISILLLFSVQTWAAEEDLFASFDRTICQKNEKTQKITCTLDGKPVKSELDKKSAQPNLVDDELDVTTSIE